MLKNLSVNTSSNQENKDNFMTNFSSIHSIFEIYNNELQFLTIEVSPSLMFSNLQIQLLRLCSSFLSCHLFKKYIFN
jgi:hypothetical protein